MNKEQQIIKELLDAQVKGVQEVSKRTSQEFIGRMPDQRIILTTYGAISAVQQSMRDVLLKMGVNPELVKEINDR